MPPAPWRRLQLVVVIFSALLLFFEVACWVQPSTHSPSVRRRRHPNDSKPMGLAATATAGAGNGGDGEQQQVIHEPASLNPRAEDYSIMAGKVSPLLK